MNASSKRIPKTDRPQETCCKRSVQCPESQFENSKHWLNTAGARGRFTKIKYLKDNSPVNKIRCYIK